MTDPPLTHAQDGKTQRYDRQLRLWGSAGQAGLEQASVLVVNGTASATQTLKNLVLPGIGSFAILDRHRVTAADIGHNFFLEPSSLGHSRAQEAVKFLLELNDGVQGRAIEEDVGAFLASRGADALGGFTLVIAVDTKPEDTLALANRCWTDRVPFIHQRSCGFLASCRIQNRETTVIETHPEKGEVSKLALRLNAPFPELIAHANTVDLATTDAHEHTHIPAVVVIVRALEEWRRSHNGANPATYAERKSFRDQILAQKRNVDEDNFDEAADLGFKQTFLPPRIPPGTQALFDDPACETITRDSPPFWLLVRALRDAVRSSPDTPPMLPLIGSIVDMKATSAGFRALQLVYRAKAQADLARVRQCLAQVLSSVGLGTEAEVIGTNAELETFVKNAAFLHVARGVSLADERGVDAAPYTGEALQAQLESEHSLVPIYYALRASEVFQAQHGRWPGVAPCDVEDDNAELVHCARSILKPLGSANDHALPSPSLEALAEVCVAGLAHLGLI